MKVAIGKDIFSFDYAVESNSGTVINPINESSEWVRVKPHGYISIVKRKIRKGIKVSKVNVFKEIKYFGAKG